MTDSRQMIAYIASSNQRQVIYNPNDNTYTPNYATTSNTLTPELYIAGGGNNKINEAKSVSWSVQTNSVGEFIPVVDSTAYGLGSNHILEIRENVLEENNSMTYKVDIVYTDSVSGRDVLLQADFEVVKLSNGATKDSIIAILTNDAQIIPTDFEGANGSYFGAETEVIVLNGTVEVTNTWTVTAEPSTGVTGTRTGTAYKVTGITTDSGYVDLVATKGTERLVKRFTVTRVKSGEQGKSSYLWIMYSTASDGAGMVAEATDAKYIGVLATQTSVRPTDPSNYSWSLIKGEVGDSALTALLTNDVHVVATNAEGTDGDFTTATSTLKILEGTRTVTSEWVVTANVSTGVTGTLTGATYQVEDLSTDSGEIELVGTKGDLVLSKFFSISKNKQGIKGIDSTVYRLKKSHAILIKGADGMLTPSAVTFSSTALNANTEVDFNGYYTIYERAEKAMTVDEYTALYEANLIMPDREYLLSSVAQPYVKRYESSVAEAKIDYIPNSDIITVHIELYKDAERTQLLDKETIMVASDGIDGEDVYRVEILSTRGNIFKNGEIGTTLVANVYKGSEDITANVNSANFRWTRASTDTAGDTTWNNKYAGGRKEVAITNEDVYVRATFSCQILGE